nr:MAG TPA: hypothetical protein [Caudoviricetes sp.]
MKTISDCFRSFMGIGSTGIACLSVFIGDTV